MMNVTDYTNIKTLLIKFKEKSDVLYAKATALSNYATIEWVGTQIPSVGNGTVTIKQNGTSKGSFTMNQSGGATINLTDTTYSSLSAVSGGTDKSLVTTGEKYTWNSKQAAISDLATIRSNAATAHGWGDHSKAGYITGITKAMVESVLTGNIASHTHTFASLTSKPTTLSGYGITDASRIFRYTIPASGNKGVRITFTSGEPVKITVSGANQGAQLVLVGTGYGDGGFVRNNFTEVVPSNGQYTWCVSNDSARSVEIFSTRTTADIVTVESPSPVTFTAISALSTDAAYRHLLTSENYSKYALPLTGGGMYGPIIFHTANGFPDAANAMWGDSTGLFFKATGVFKVFTNNEWCYIYHTGNCNKSDVNWTCNTMSSMAIGSPYSDVFDANNPDRWINSNYGSAEKNYSNMPSGWEYGTVLTIGQHSFRGINGDLNAQFVWDVQHSEDINNPGRLWWRTKNSRIGWKNWQELLHTGNYSSYALPRTGGTITGSIKLEGDYPSIVPFVRNFKSATAGGWSRAIAEIRVDNKNAFRIAAYGSYTPNAENNKIQHAYLGFAGYDGLNLRISETSLSWGDNVIYHAGNCNLPTIPWTCSSLTATNDVTAKAGLYGQYLEFTSIGSSANHGGYIDFHFNGSTADYTSRIIEDDSHQLTLLAQNVVVGTEHACCLYLQRPSSNYIWAKKTGGALCLGTADGGETSALNSGINIIGKKVYIGGTQTGSDALNVAGVAHATIGIYTDGYISARRQDTASDIKLKKDFRKIDNALKYVLNTHYTRFRWKDDDKESIGIIAQEEQNREYGFLVQNRKEIGHLTYDYAASTALLGAAIQEEDSKVEKLQKRIIKLENELSNLKKKWQH